MSVCPYPEKKNHPSFVNISPTIVNDTSMERSSRVLQHGNPKIWFSFQKRSKLNFASGLLRPFPRLNVPSPHWVHSPWPPNSPSPVGHTFFGWVASLHTLSFFLGSRPGHSPVGFLYLGVLAASSSFAMSPSSTWVDLRLYDLRHLGLPLRNGSNSSS